MSSEEEQQQNIERMASAIEDLLYMGAIKFGDADQDSEKAILSNQFSIIVSNVMSNMKNFKEDDDNEVMKLMYYSLLIYLNEHLKLPKSLTMAFGNDLEKRREEMQSGELISNYVAVLHSIFSKQRKDMKKM
ncbi:MAG TPA: hypothetical protein VFH25_08545 [Nitrososphaeraceae archaeon]|jgi:hypothetical protein|nr:hypothetical protein [Nitrososphaeraceae archaeon]HET6800597.1 hypothetical protein [Nitrososphaeraceae archaeon]